MTLPKEQIDAIRQCLRILAPLHSPTMRETMSRNAEEYIQKGKWFPAFKLEHIPLLYYPSDSIKAAAMREAMENAYQSGELPGGNLYKRRFTPSQMAAWTDCPLVPANSPLRFWLDDFMQADTQQTAPEQNTATPAALAIGNGPAKGKAKKPSIETVALDYMRKAYKAEQFSSAAKFHKHLIKTAGVTDSPFEMGTALNARRLFCPDAGSFYDVGTLGKLWPKIRAG